MRVLKFDGVPARYTVASDEVHLWSIGLDREVDPSVLSDLERERAARFRDPLHARRYVAAHVALRQLLARYLGRTAAVLTFGTDGMEGKPRLDDAPAFNLTHTEDRALLAVHGGERVGVDLERPRALSDFRLLASQYFTDDEYREVQRGDLAERFFTVWTRKEAALKAIGHGLTVNLRRIEVGALPESVRIEFGGHTLDLESFRTADGYIGALAVGAPSKIARIGTYDAGCIRS